MLLILALVVATVVANAQATVKDLSGWAWSDANIGWVSFNSNDNNTGTNGSGKSPIAYKVQLDTSTGNLSGYAWSSNIGWIKFGGLSSFPSGGVNANVNVSTGAVTGYARACAGTASGNCSSMTSRTDGWDGWISLSGTNHATGNTAGTGGVTYVVDGTTATLKGNSWGSDVVGWLKFSPTTGVDTRVTDGNDITGTCNVSPTSVNVGSPVNVSVSDVTGGSGTYSYSWNAGGSASITGQTSSAASITYTTGSGASPYIPVVSITGSVSGSASVVCAPVTVTGTSQAIKLLIGANSASLPTDYYGTTGYDSYTTNSSKPFTLRWNIKMPGATCTATPPATLTGWIWTGDPNASGDFTSNVPVGTPTGPYQFSIFCDDGSTTETSNVILNVKKSSLEEI